MNVTSEVGLTYKRNANMYINNRYMGCVYSNFSTVLKHCHSELKKENTVYTNVSRDD